jgi:multidrug efflux pump subunit AcrA (membrane-fusion protein)
MTIQRLVILPAFSALLFSACTQKQGGGEGAGEVTTPPVVSVKVSRVHRGTLDVSVVATGKVDVIRRQKVISPVAGTLLSLKALEGMAVQRGAVLALIRPREAQTAIAGAEALLQNARTEAGRAEAQAALDLATSTQNMVSVRAVFQGVVASRNVTEGELVAENAELMTVIDLSTIVFVAEVPLRDAPRIEKGQRASLEFQSLPGHPFAARVDAVYPGSDSQSQTVGVRLRLNEAGEGVRRLLRPSMMGICRIITGVHRNVLIVPKAALLRDDEKNAHAVVVVGPDSLARLISVDVGVTTDSTAEVQGRGIDEGTTVVVEGNYALPDSTRVRW